MEPVISKANEWVNFSEDTKDYFIMKGTHLRHCNTAFEISSTFGMMKNYLDFKFVAKDYGLTNSFKITEVD